jgi:hypothetical protein
MDKKRMFIIHAVCLVALLCADRATVFGACSDDTHFWADHGVHCWDDFTELTGYLNNPDRRSPVFRIVQPRNGRDTAIASHNQFFNACFFFSIAPIMEHLGYSRFERFGSYTYDMDYLTSGGLMTYNDFDAGYFGSPEHLIATYVHYDTHGRGIDGGAGVGIYPCGFFLDDDCDDLAGSPRTDLNQSQYPCKWYFDPADCNPYAIFDDGTEYGFCSDISQVPSTRGSVDTFDRWLNTAQCGCGSTECPCSPDASCGSFGFLNQVLVSDARIGGCNDALNFSPAGSDEEQYLRKVIRAFVDHNIPLLAAVDDGGHFMTLIGYADLDEAGLPCTAILADPIYRTYWTADLTAWGLTDRDDERWALVGITPWAQHLDGGCDEGGWAKAFDEDQTASQSLRDKFRLCRTAGNDMSRCVDRYYGIQLSCYDEGLVQSRYHAYVEDPFIAVPRNTSCDMVALRWADGNTRVESATINRYWYNTGSKGWERISSYTPDSNTAYGASPGHSGGQNLIVWDEAWPENYWLAAEGLPSPTTKRRTTVELSLSDGSQKRVEIAPPGTYGLTVNCIDNGQTVATYFAEADHDVFTTQRPDMVSRQFFVEDRNVSCDSVGVKVSLGYGSAVSQAEIERWYYGTDGRWLKANATAPWESDQSYTLEENLTGTVKGFLWTESWPDDHWLVADGVGSGADWGSRKTIIRLYNRGGEIAREIEIVPIAEEACPWNQPLDAPDGRYSYSYKPLGGSPIMHFDPEHCRPLAVGTVAYSVSASDDSDTLSLRLGFPPFSSRMDIYVGFMSEAFPGMYLITNDHEDPIHDIDSGLSLRWATNTFGDFDLPLLGDIAEPDLPEGRYTFVVLLVPAGSTTFEDYYAWTTYFDIRRDCAL